MKLIVRTKSLLCWKVQQRNEFQFVGNRSFEFSVVNQKKKYYNINIGNEALPWVIIPKPQLC